MKRFMYRLLNILLLPARIYERLNDRRLSLYLGIIAVGIIDVFFPDVTGMYKSTFTGKTSGDLQFNILFSIALVLLIGAVDVVFFSIPLFDIFKFIKRREGAPFLASPIKVMKAYIISNFMLLPIALIIQYAVFNNVKDISASPFLQNLALADFYIMLIWPSAIVTRGINALFKFNPIFRRLTFIIVFTWAFIFGVVLRYQIAIRLLALLK